MLVHVDVKMPNVSQAIDALGVGPTGSVQSFLTQRVLLHMRPYMPWLSGEMATGQTSQTGPAEITVNAPQARYLYMGSKMRDPNGGGPFPIYEGSGVDKRFTGEFRYRKGAHPVATGVPLSYTRTVNPYAGDHWDQTMMRDQRDAIVAEVTEYARRQV